MKLIDAEPTLRRMLAEARLDPDALEPWNAWKVFKAFLRIPADCDEDAASFQSGFDEEKSEESPFYVELVRQFSAVEDEREELIGRVVVELVYAPAGFAHVPASDAWSYDFPSLTEFAQHVEGTAVFQAAINQPVFESAVYAEFL
jgi:hypothetical protein